MKQRCVLGHQCWEKGICATATGEEKENAKELLKGS